MYRIFQLVVSLVNIFNTPDLGKEDNEYLELISNDVEKNENIFKEQYSMDNDKNNGKKNDNENDNDEEDEDEDDDSDDYTSDDDDESDDEIMSYLKQKHLEEAENEMKTNKGISDKSDTISLEKHNELQNIKMSTYYLDRIKLYDKNVTGNNYA